MKLQAYVFCGCYEHGRVKCPPPDPQIVDVLTNGDVACHHPTPAQYQVFLKWCYRACYHRDGLITGGLLGHRLPVKVMHRAMLPHRRTFPLFVRKVLGCKPQTRYSHLTLKQVEQLQIELARMEKFHLSDRKHDNELQYYRGQMKQLVRAALKFQQPIAM
jgi:hypothetical protein